MLPQTARVTVLVNASAGTIQSRDHETLARVLGTAFGRHGITATLEFIASADLRRAALAAHEKSKAQELDAIVIGGGDGSIRTVAGVLAGTPVPLGILPLGTLNHFAKDVGIPLDLDAAVAVIAAGRTRAVDVGEVNGRVFVNNSSIGVYPYLVLERDRGRRRKGLSKWTAMVLAGLKVLRHLPLRSLSVCAAGWVDPVKTAVVLVGNNAYSFTGLSLGRRERLDAGELSLYVAKARSRLALFRLAFWTVMGRPNDSGQLRSLRLRSVEIRSRQRRLFVALDGEVEVLRTPLVYRIRPAALQVFGPEIE